MPSVLFVQLANSLHPQEVRPGIAVTTVTGTLVTKDNRYTLEPLDLTGEGCDKTRYVNHKGERVKILFGYLRSDCEFLFR